MDRKQNSLDNVLDVRELLYKIRNNWYYFLLSILLSLFVAFAYTRYSNEFYKVSTKIMINSEDEGSDASEILYNNLSGKNNSSIIDRIQLLSSYQLVLQTVSDLRFDVSYYLVGNIKTSESLSAPIKIICDTSMTQNNPITSFKIEVINETAYQVFNERLNYKEEHNFGDEIQIQEYNFVVERAAFTGIEIGILQSLREVPGFLAFTTIFVLLVVREQIFAVFALSLLGLGVAITGFFPTVFGLYFTTVLMSIGFHYFEAVKQSLSLQWLPKDEAPQVLGRLIAIGSLTSLIVYGSLWFLLEIFKASYLVNFFIAGGLCMILALVMYFVFPVFPAKTIQNKNLILRKRYWLYYLLTFLSGARRQIFMVFAAFLMVEKFGYSASQVTLLFLINYLLRNYETRNS